MRTNKYRLLFCRLLFLTNDERPSSKLLHRSMNMNQLKGQNGQVETHVILGIGVGIGIGVALAVALGSVVLGMGAGIAIGAGIVTTQGKRKGSAKSKD